MMPARQLAAKILCIMITFLPGAHHSAPYGFSARSFYESGDLDVPIWRVGSRRGHQSPCHPDSEECCGDLGRNVDAVAVWIHRLIGRARWWWSCDGGGCADHCGTANPAPTAANSEVMVRDLVGRIARLFLLLERGKLAARPVFARGVSNECHMGTLGPDTQRTLHS
jgi:hypothetical protein